MRQQYPCDTTVRVSIRDSGAEFECFITSRSPRPGLAKSAGSRHLQIDQKHPRRKSINKKNVRFDEASNEFHTAEDMCKEGEEKDGFDDSDLWYTSEDFERFTNRIQARVEKLCESMFSKASVEVLERTQQTCMAKDTDDLGEENVFSIPEHELKELISTYNETEHLVGLEPYVAEYMPNMVDHFERHDVLVDEVLNDDISKFMSGPSIPMDQKSRHVSLGSRLFAHQIARAAAECIRQERRADGTDRAS